MIVRDRPFLDLLPCHGELSTASYSDNVGEVLAGKEGFESRGVGDFGRFGRIRV